MYHQRPPEPFYGQQERIYLDDYNSDLHLNIEDDGFTANDNFSRGFEFMWAGVRATHGVTRGKVFFEVHVLENLPVTMPETESNPNVCRVGWSVDSLEIALGETQLSYGYGGTGKASTNSKFFDYGGRYSAGDVITCYLDLDATPKAIFFTKNGQFLGVAFRIGNELEGRPLFPHVYVKNMRFRVNFGQDRPAFRPEPGFRSIAESPVEFLSRGPRGPTHREECEILMMVGLPGVGKTVWCTKYVSEHADKRYHILGTNTIIDKMKVMGLSRKRNYHGRWDQLIKQATDILNQTFKIAERKNRNYVLDQTNVYPNARRRKMNNFRGYHRKAVVMVTENSVLKERSEKREREEGKIVPEQAVMEMKANFTLPEVGEIFEEVMFVEEDAERSRVLIQEFQQEGKAFQEAAKKRPAEEQTEPKDQKKPNLNQDVKPSIHQQDVKPNIHHNQYHGSNSTPNPSRWQDNRTYPPRGGGSSYPSREVPHNRYQSPDYRSAYSNEPRPGDLPPSRPPPPGPKPTNDRPYGGGYSSTPVIKKEPGVYNIPSSSQPPPPSHYSHDPYSSKVPDSTYQYPYQPPGSFPSSGYDQYSTSTTSDQYYGSNLSQQSGYSSGYGSQDSMYGSNPYSGGSSQSSDYQNFSQGSYYDQKPYQQQYPPPPPTSHMQPPPPRGPGDYYQRYDYQGR